MGFRVINGTGISPYGIILAPKEPATTNKSEGVRAGGETGLILNLSVTETTTVSFFG